MFLENTVKHKEYVAERLNFMSTFLFNEHLTSQFYSRLWMFDKIVSNTTVIQKMWMNRFHIWNRIFRVYLCKLYRWQQKLSGFLCNVSSQGKLCAFATYFIWILDRNNCNISFLFMIVVSNIFNGFTERHAITNMYICNT